MMVMMVNLCIHLQTKLVLLGHIESDLFDNFSHQIFPIFPSLICVCCVYLLRKLFLLSRKDDDSSVNGDE